MWLPFRRIAPQTGTEIMTKIARGFFTDESGASAAEYAVLLTLITVVLIAAVQALGGAISNIFHNVATTLNNAA